MGARENKALISRLYEEVYANWDFTVLNDLIAPDFVGHGTASWIPPGPEGVRRFYEQMRSAFPDLRYTVDDMIAADDKVVVRWTWRGTHRGEYYGIAPTGKEATATGIAIYRIQEGKCIERWVGLNLLGLLRHLGAAVPDAGQPVTPA